jgi:hypothetical protein
MERGETIKEKEIAYLPMVACAVAGTTAPVVWLLQSLAGEISSIDLWISLNFCRIAGRCRNSGSSKADPRFIFGTSHPNG